MENRKLTYELATLKDGQEDNNLTRMERWVEAQNMSLSSLTQDEWIDVMEHILPMTRAEIVEWLAQMQARRSMGW